MKIKIINFFLILSIICAGFFYLKRIQINLYLEEASAARFGEVIINEIAWMGTEKSNSDEWIELKNIGNSEINLENWILAAKDGSPIINLSGSISSGAYFLLERTDDDSVFGISADLIYSGVLENNGEDLELKDESGNIIDNVDAGGGWMAGNNESKRTMERINDFQWQDSLIALGTPMAQNSFYSESEEVDDEINEEQNNNEEENHENIEDDDFIASILGDVVINEFVSDPADNEVEWIELYNTTGAIINIDGWTIAEGSGASTVLSGILGVNNDSKFFIIEKPSGNLNNKGDIIILRDKNGNLIDTVSYGNWDDAQINNNAPVASDPYSVARKIDGFNSFNNLNDFVLSSFLTKGESNIIIMQEEDEVSSEEKKLYDYSNDIIISEIFPNPKGSDNDEEFIELCNIGSIDINLNGWKLGDESSKKYEFKLSAEDFAFDKNIIKAGEYLVIYRRDSKIALNNSVDSVKLFQPLKDNPLQEVKYEKVIEGWSYSNANMFIYGEWKWSEIITPGSVNEIKTVNHNPEIDFYFPEKIFVGSPVFFDSSDTFDEDSDNLEFSWDFGDGIILDLPNPEHTYFKEGTYIVELTVSDGENESKIEKIAQVDGNSEKDISSSGFSENGLDVANVLINEILPNPAGTDADEEWIEIKNTGSTKINMFNWILDDIEGGSKPYFFNYDLWIDAGDFLSIERIDSGLALNNNNDATRLFNNLGELVDEVEYGDTFENESYARGQNGKWFWTTILTKEEENIISVSESIKNEFNNIDISKVNLNDNLAVYSETTLENIKEFEVGDFVKVAGTVAVKPGILGLQYFYITGSPGIQIYNYKKEFPNLEIGDYIEVNGELSVSGGESRLKTKTQEDIKIIERRENPNAAEMACEKISEDFVGCLISITGEVVERKSYTMYLDDGTDEAVVYIKKATGINPNDIKEGDILSVIGIVGRTASGIRIMPRSIDDIIKKDVESYSDEKGLVLGEIAVSDEWEIAKRDKKLELFKHLIVIFIAIIIILSGMLFKISRMDSQK